MTQKDKVKELVGRGLNSYHTKALQQMERIEKKNKEQNHKISILSNELDNDYLTKTEEGSVISLEHSKEGMVYLDELQGNTLVNYCTDGSKELTLNGDIDVEGVLVTTTEGVDNGKVDVLCEGNTLVNLYDWNSLVQNGIKLIKYNRGFKYVVDEPKTNEWIFQGFTKPPYKDNTTYTFIINITKNTFPNKNIFRIFRPESTNGSGYWIAGGRTGILKCVITTNSTKASDWNGVNTNFGFNLSDVGELIVEDMILLEGDWTNKEIPPYFEGMKSVGQDDENGHKIEILLQNKNLFNKDDEWSICTYAGGKVSHEEPIFYTFEDNKVIVKGQTLNRDVLGYKCKIIDDRNIVLSLKSQNLGGTLYYACYTEDWQYTKTQTTKTYEIVGNRYVCRLDETDIPQGTKYVLLGIGNAFASNYEMEDIMIEYGTKSTNYSPYQLNKKEILLNEPLRGLPNGVKDKFIKQSNKWYIERNLCEYKITGEENILTYDANSENAIIQYYITGLPNMIVSTNTVNGISDKFNFIKSSDRFHESSHNHLWCSNSHIALMYLKSANLTTNDVQNLLRGTTVVYQLATPIYEEITDVELITYLDTTHISNNSIIPCNMKIKNTGYNAIIKPSTLYTVALDTNKSGTIGMNLGGAKVTTTNNVATITTPATLADDSLRLYGKDIKGSKVRLLEGDKTNWIPSHFEGMKSSFEDKLQDDGSYKMEILSNNKNLFDITKVPNETTVENLGDCLKITGYANDLKVVASFLTPNKTYTTSTTLKEIQGTNNGLAGNIRLYNPKTGHWITSKTFIAPQNIKDYRIYLYGMQGNPSECIVSNMQIFEGNEVSLYTPHKSNKIQFSSIEPLRRVGNSKDRILFINNKLMIERNTKQTVLVGNVTEGWGEPSSHTTSNKCLLFSSKKTNELKTYSKIYSDRFMTPNETNAGDDSLWKIDREGIGHTIYNDVRIRIDRERLTTPNKAGFIKWLSENPTKIVCELAEPYYEEIPFELQKIILEGYENGTLFFDTNIPPTSTITYAGETPIVKSVKLNKTEVLNNTNDINDNIIPYLIDMDYRVVCLQLQSENTNDGVSMARLFGGAYEMLQRDIQSKRYSVDEYRHRLDAYLSANKITEEEYNKLGDMLNE